MGKFGKKNVVSTDLSRYMIGIMAPSGFGKTTLMCNVCQKEFGDDGYIIFDMGDEDGTAAIDGVVAERMPNYKHVYEVVNDIVAHKDEYPNLKVVVLDTLDADFEIAEKFAIQQWNERNLGKKDFVKATSINTVEGGFGKGLDKTIEIAKDIVPKLASVGVGVWWTAHVKEKDQVDLMTGDSYTMLTANLTGKYFNAFKNISHIIGFGYIDRSIERVAVGEVNPVTKKQKERKAVKSENRRIKFRDDNLVADAKGRFSEITDEIDLDADQFIRAIKDAINAERSKSGSAAIVSPKKVVLEKPDLEDHDAVYDDDTVVNPKVIGVDLTASENEEDEFDDEAETPEYDIDALKASIKAADRTAVKAALAKYGKKFSELNDSEVVAIAEALNIL